MAEVSICTILGAAVISVNVTGRPLGSRIFSSPDSLCGLPQCPPDRAQTRRRRAIRDGRRNGLCLKRRMVELPDVCRMLLSKRRRSRWDAPWYHFKSNKTDIDCSDKPRPDGTGRTPPPTPDLRRLAGPVPVILGAAWRMIHQRRCEVPTCTYRRQ